MDAWRGAAAYSRDPVLSKNAAITRAKYEECGADYLQEHFASNVVAQPLEQSGDTGGGDDGEEDDDAGSEDIAD